MAILLPAVQSAREAARRSQCVSNLKQIALAMHQYHGVHAVLPPGKKGCCWGTWLVYVLPYLEQQPSSTPGIPAASTPPVRRRNYDLDLRYFGVANQTVTSTFVSSYLCPSDQTNAPITATTNGNTFACTSQNYAVNFGNSIVIQTDFQDIKFGGAPFVDIGSPDGDHNQPGHPTVGFNAFLDGLSNTMLVSEVVVGQGQDLRGFSWWGDAATFETFLTPNSSFPDVHLQPLLLHQPVPEPSLHGRDNRAARQLRRAEPAHRAASTSPWVTARFASSRTRSTSGPGGRMSTTRGNEVVARQPVLIDPRNARVNLRFHAHTVASVSRRPLTHAYSN